MIDRNKILQPLELWAGVECTVNRVGESYYDQLERSGHALRLRDLDRLADLGVRTVRYPILWERTAPNNLDDIDWSWSDERLSHLRGLRLKPVVGLLHHGSGPRNTHLLDPDFPEKFKIFAAKVASRYPWVNSYTPVNEPLTTARFSCLYGHWYPHTRDPLQFALAFLAQCRAIVLAMKAIREVSPQSKLIQTEDLGKTFSTQTLAYQADFENERRWLTFDLLCGRLKPQTPMWEYFRWLGIKAQELDWFLENTCPPDIIGINYYITGERFLDERLTRYPPLTHGGNEQHSYADVEAVRVCSEGLSGPKAIIREAWDRYHLPMAITEAHLGCTREEQLRWFKEVWDGALESKAAGINIRAVTAWSAFGAFDWDSLLTCNNGSYEPGLFDVRSPTPRPTALARMARELSAGKEFDHPAVDSVGWWHKFDRFSYPAVTHRAETVAFSAHGVNPRGRSTRSLLIAGGAGTLGTAFARICERRGIAYHLLTRKELDIANSVSVERALDGHEPWAIINTAGYVKVDEAEREVEKCRRENLVGPALLALECAKRDIKLITFSSDLVFDGLKVAPYVESDITCPLSVYGRSKAEAESAVLDSLPSALVIRTSCFFGPWDRFSFVYSVLESLDAGRPFQAAADLLISATYVPDLVNATLDILMDGETGVWHLVNPGAVTWADWARLTAERGGYDPRNIEAVPAKSFGFIARRPAASVLTSERANLLPSFDHAMDSYFQESEPCRVAENVVSFKR